jgi:RNA polymerase I-specific transcription initiation factor RRN3
MAYLTHGGAVATSTTTTPLKPILSRKTSTILGTRGRDDGDDEFGSERRPSKRQKTVVFDETLNVVKQIGNKSLADIKKQVRKALENHQKGDDGYYDELKEIFGADRNTRPGNEEGVDPRELGLYVVALTSSTTKLDRCSGLIKNVLGCQWLARDDVFVKAYIQFL